MIARMTGSIIIREMTDRDIACWAEMRCALWPGDSADAHAEGAATILRNPDAWAFVAETGEGIAAGFAELALRPYANGCDSQPVPFLEGIWVKPDFRRCGIGRALILHVEAFVVARGFREIGSDTEIANQASQEAHAAWGFSETERVVYFRKLLA
jgi:aminoglycoside 6'-N-acetyltransferase I